MRITYYGHSAFCVETAGKSMLFDPFVSANPHAAHIDVDSIKADFVLVSHGHGDHITDAARIAKNNNSLAIGVYEITEWLAKQGVEHTHGMNIGGSREFPFGKLKLAQAVHSSTLPDGSPGGVPCGFVVHNAEDTFYFAGDTALYSDMKLIGEKFKLKAAFLPIGNNFTMDAEDAAIAAEWLGVKTVIGMHYDTFPMITINHEAAKNIFHNVGIQLHLMAVGSELTI